MNIQNTPRPTNALIGYSELSEALGRPVKSLHTVARTLPFKRWRVSGAVVFDADEVAAYRAARLAARKRKQDS